MYYTKCIFVSKSGKIIMSLLHCVEARVNFHDISDSLDHLVAHALSCRIKNDDFCVKEYESICFGSLDKVIKVNDLGCLIMEGTKFGKH